jgi:hypothetical protein
VVLSQEELDLHRVVSEFKSLPGTNLPADIQVQRLQFLKAIFATGVPLRRTEPLRALYERHALKLTSPNHMSDYIPALQYYLQQLLLREVRGQFLNLTFDSTSSKSDVYAFVLRWMDQDLNMHTRLARVGLYKSSLVSAELARISMDFLHSEAAKAATIAAASHDSASLNGAAMELVQKVRPEIINLACVCHLADLVGSKLEMPDLHQFFTHWHNLFAHSLKSRLYFKEFFKKRLNEHSPTRYVFLDIVTKDSCTRGSHFFFFFFGVCVFGQVGGRSLNKPSNCLKSGRG